MADKIQNAYESSKHIYDDVLTQGSILSKLYIKFFWSGTDDNEIARELLSYIPDDYSGNILDVLDYSKDMIEQAENRLGQYKHISFVQGDVGKLPTENETFDMVLSMNGFHIFPDKDKAFQETWCVLKKDGTIIACFYIKEKSRVTDWLVKNILSKKGWFMPPFHTENELKIILEKFYKNIDMHVDGSIVYFKCFNKLDKTN